jgi:orotidine-5'-phosphate decarboxylase
MNASKLIVALDVDTPAKARNLVSALRGIAGMFKIGSQLFTAAGPSLVREIVNSGERIFLDLKYHDIPNTVAQAGVEATRLGVSIFNIHASGGGEMMQRTADAVTECAANEGVARPLVIGVTALTSSNAASLAEVGISDEPAKLVSKLAQLAKESGMDGVVASPQEIALVRAAVKSERFVVVTPGIRPAGSDVFDQKRVTTPREAMLAGADYIVVGRPILSADDPVAAARQIIAEMEMATAGSGAI